MRTRSLQAKSCKRPKANRETVSEPSANHHKPAKVARNRVSPPQRELILQMSAAGSSIKDISKKVKRNRETVSRIVRGPEMQKFVMEMREKFLGLAPAAIGAVQNAFTKQKDGRLAFQFLSSIGVTPSPEEKALLTAPPIPTPSDEEAGAKRVMSALMDVAIQRAKLFGYKMPELDEDLRAVGGRLNYETYKLEPIDKEAKASKR